MLAIKDWRVGHVVEAVLVEGVYPYLAIPELLNTVPNEAVELLSLLTRRIVTTSFVLASIQVLILVSHA